MVSFELLFEILAMLLVILLIIIILFNVILWKRSHISTLKAKVFLDEHFLRKNFLMFSILGVVIGFSLSFHIFMEMVQWGDVRIPASIYPFAHFLYYSALLVSLTCILIMGIYWNNLLKKRDEMDLE